MTARRRRVAFMGWERAMRNRPALFSKLLDEIVTFGGRQSSRRVMLEAHECRGPSVGTNRPRRGPRARMAAAGGGVADRAGAPAAGGAGSAPPRAGGKSDADPDHRP